MKRKKSESACPVFSRCGACSHIDVPYEEQLAKKKNLLSGLLGGFGKVNKVVGMEDPYHYRCKVMSVLMQGKGGRVEAGNYAAGKREIVPVRSCLAEDENADRIISDIADLLSSFKMKIYNDRTGYGNFRYVLVRVGKNTGEIMVIIVTRSPVFPSRNNFVRAILKLHPEITTIVHNVNDRTDSLVLGSRNNVLFGRGYIEDSLCGLRFRISAGSFYQVNPVMAQKVYEKAVSFIPEGFKGVVLDAYCGTGTIGLIAASKAETVIGVEQSPDAVRDAITNSKINNIKNAGFYRGDAGDFLRNFHEEGGRIDFCIMDPPRQGSSPEFIDTLRKISPANIIYISCNPVTLKRDLEILTKKGDRGRTVYKVRSITGFDMFPFTGEVESCVLLERVSNRKADSRIRIDVDLEDYYRIKANKSEKA